MSPIFQSYRGHRIKQSKDRTAKFWIIDELTGVLIQTLEPGSFEAARVWIDGMLGREDSDNQESTNQEAKESEEVSI